MSAKFNEYIYTNIIRSFRNREKGDEFVRFVESLKNETTIPVMLKRDIIEACGSEVFYPAKGVIMDYFEQFNDIPEIKITCIRALGRLGGEDVCRLIGQCLYDEDWRVRAVAARNAHLCGVDIIRGLRRCLYDKNYYVRINSAESLSRLGEMGIQALTEETGSTDRFTKDVSQYMLRKVESHA